MKLKKNEYYKVRSMISEIEFDPIYVYSIIDGIQEGVIYVDNKEHPSSAFLQHTCGFTYTLGNPDNPEFNQLVHKLLLSGEKKFLICLTNANWEQSINHTSDLALESSRRFCFRFDPERFDINNHPLPTGYQIIPMNHSIFETISGKVIPTHYWKSAEYFLEKGYGVCLINPNGEIVSSSFSACVANGCMDIGIQTMSGFEGQGFATITAARMVLYALEHGYAPVWGCHFQNVGSYSVAHKLGFINTGCWDTLIGQH